jgi:GT2 family glycosyltransferase
MGTHWNTEPPPSSNPYVQIASSAGTVLERALFENIGGYDEGMLRYSGFEPEFSVRAWRAGAEIWQAPTIQVTHRFKTEAECARFIRPLRTAIVHNCLRFGVTHLPEVMILEMVRYKAAQFPNQIQKALNMLEERGAWRRRHQLIDSLEHDFIWFAERFALLDEIGEPIPRLGGP